MFAPSQASNLGSSSWFVPDDGQQGGVQGDYGTFNHLGRRQQDEFSKLLEEIPRATSAPPHLQDRWALVSLSNELRGGR